MPTSGEEIQRRFEAPNDAKEKNTHTATRVPSIIVGVVAAVVVALSVFYLLRPVPLLVQGEVDATRLDIAARVDGRVKEIPVERGQNVPAGAVLVRIDNPETVAKFEQMKERRPLRRLNLPTCSPERGWKPLPLGRRKWSGRRQLWCWRRRPLTALRR